MCEYLVCAALSHCCNTWHIAARYTWYLQIADDGCFNGGFVCRQLAVHELTIPCYCSSMLVMLACLQACTWHVRYMCNLVTSPAGTLMRIAPVHSLHYNGTGQTHTVCRVLMLLQGAIIFIAKHMTQIGGFLYEQAQKVWQQAPSCMDAISPCTLSISVEPRQLLP